MLRDLPPDLHVLAETSGKDAFGITASADERIHGQARPLGSQNEGFFQCRWTKYRPTCEERGHYNDCHCAWSGAYRMMALDNLSRVLGEKDFTLLR